MQPILYLRTSGSTPPLADRGNAFLDSLVGARICPVTVEQYKNRNQLMQQEALVLQAQGERVYVIPEGGSNGLGALGYVDAMKEVRDQLNEGQAEGLESFDAVVHACGSGGTAAGVCLGAARYAVAPRTLAMAVCEDEAYFRQTIKRIMAEAQQLDSSLTESNQLDLIDRFKGPAYAVPTTDQVRFIVEVARTTGLIFDPVYTGKALYGLAHMEDKPRRVLFIHTGGLPGLLAQTDDFSSYIVEVPRFI